MIGNQLQKKREKHFKYLNDFEYMYAQNNEIREDERERERRKKIQNKYKM